MERMNYYVFAGLLIASLLIAILGGGAFWVLPVLIWPMVIGYAFWDRRAKRRESRDERLMAR